MFNHILLIKNDLQSVSLDISKYGVKIILAHCVVCIAEFLY